MIRTILQSSLCSLTRTKASPVGIFAKLSYVSLINARSVHITSANQKVLRMGNEKIRVGASKYVTLDGENTIEVQSAVQKESQFPDACTPDQLFNGVPFNQLHIINIKSGRNNTIMSMTDHTGKGILTHSAGIEGFKNAKKGTNIAAQQTAVTFGTRTLERGIKTVRLRVQGIGAGRMAAIKGIALAGVNIISITDDTRVSWNPPRPRKMRRL